GRSHPLSAEHRQRVADRGRVRADRGRTDADIRRHADDQFRPWRIRRPGDVCRYRLQSGPRLGSLFFTGCRSARGLLGRCPHSARDPGDDCGRPGRIVSPGNPRAFARHCELVAADFRRRAEIGARSLCLLDDFAGLRREPFDRLVACGYRNGGCHRRPLSPAQSHRGGPRNSRHCREQARRGIGRDQHEAHSCGRVRHWHDAGGGRRCRFDSVTIRLADNDGHRIHPEGVRGHRAGRSRQHRRSNRRRTAAWRGGGPRCLLLDFGISRRLWPRRVHSRPPVPSRRIVRPLGAARMNTNLFGLALLLVIGLAYPFVLPGYLTVGITMLLFIGWATSWDILGGWAGQVSLGHSFFVGLGAYFVALGQSRYGLAPWWSIMLAILAAAALAYVWGRITFGLRGPYFALSTIAFAEIFRLIAINEKWLTGGATGVFIASLPEPFGIDLFSRWTQYYLAL